MKLTASNSTISQTVITNGISFPTGRITNETLVSGNTRIDDNSIILGEVVLSPSQTSTPSLVVGGTPISSGLYGGIVDYQEFTENGVWYNPLANSTINSFLTGYEQVLMMLWGGGGGGNTATPGRGGGGGACVISQMPLSSFTDTCSVTVGSGGTAGVNGSNTIFVINSTSSTIAYGGGRATASLNGGGGGWLSAGSELSGGAPLGGNVATTSVLINSTFGGGGVNGSVIGVTLFGGGAGTTGLVSGSSIYGGSGGSNAGAIGISLFGGTGGNSTVTATSPGGGGGAKTATATGARGEVRVWVIGPGSTTAGLPTYTLTANTTTVFEGSSVLYTVSTTNVPNGTQLFYTLNNSSVAVSSDFTSSVNGSIIVNNNLGTFSLTTVDDVDIANETIQMDIRTGSQTGPIIATNNSVTISTQPSSVTYINYALSGTVLGTSNTYTFTNMPIGEPSPSRTVVITLAAMTFSTLVSSVSIDGISMSQAGYVTSGFEDIAIFYASAPNNTTANITITLTTAPASDWNAAIATYRFITSNNTVSTSASSVGTSVNLPAAANDFVIAVGGSDDTTIGAFSSTNFTGTRDVAVDFRTSDAFVSINGRATGSTVTLTNAGLEEILAVSWKP